MLQLEAIIREVKTLKDRGLKLNVETQELVPEDMTEVFKLKDKYGFMVFKPTKITEEEIIEVPDEVKEFPKEKSPSKRLRDRMFVYYKEVKGFTKGFESWYKESLEEIGNSYLNKLK